MSTVEESIEIAAPSDLVWQRIGDFGDIASWHPAIVSSPTDGDVRTCVLEDGAEVAERLVEHSDADRFYVYTIVRGGFDIHDYNSRLEVQPSADGARVSWSGDFVANDPSQQEALSGVFAGIYRLGLDNLKTIF
jgi:hypothetical protein